MNCACCIFLKLKGANLEMWRRDVVNHVKECKVCLCYWGVSCMGGQRPGLAAPATSGRPESAASAGRGPLERNAAYCPFPGTTSQLSLPLKTKPPVPFNKVLCFIHMYQMFKKNTGSDRGRPSTQQHMQSLCGAPAGHARVSAPLGALLPPQRFTLLSALAPAPSRAFRSRIGTQ